MEELNKELQLAHTFIKEQYNKYLKSNKMKNDNERRAYAHAVQITGQIAYNYTITPRKEKQPETIMDNITTTDKKNKTITTKNTKKLNAKK